MAQSWAQLIATRPRDVCAVFVSDVHQSLRTPQINAAFVRFVNSVAALPNARRFFILGDWLDAWIGDDDYLCRAGDHWLDPTIRALAALPYQVYIGRGNRDFMIDQRLCDKACATLIDEPYYVDLDGVRCRLEHGDRLCVDDVAYQRYRRVIQSPVSLFLLKKSPLAARRFLARRIQRRSKRNLPQTQNALVDVNENRVAKVLDRCDVLIHGHTHRPFLHRYNNGKTRLALGDWRQSDGTVTASVAVLLKDGDRSRLRLAPFCDKAGI